jgi:hypothetical protein
MKALFKLPSYESQWVDSYTGETRKAADGQTAEHQGREFQSAASHRRVQELEGFTERSIQRPDSEEKLAEIVLPQKPPSHAFMRGASKFFGGNSTASEGSKVALIHTPLPAAPMRNVPLKQESLNAGSTIHSTGEGLKQSASSGIGAKIKTRDSQPKPLELEQRQVSSHQPASYELRKGEKTYYDQTSQRSVPNYTPIELEAKLNLRENSLSRDIVLDILMMKGFEPAQQTFATNELHDIATKLAVPSSAKIQHTIDHLTQALAEVSDLPLDTSIIPTKKGSRTSGLLQASRGTQDLRSAQELNISQSGKTKGLSTDVFIALERASSQTLKEDPAEQLRLGTWAVHVLAGRMDTPVTELLRGMKKDAILALGRLSMQLLSSSAPAQTTFTADSVKTKSSVESQESQGSVRGRTAGGAFAESSDMKDEQQPELPLTLPNRKTVDQWESMERSSIRGANEFFRMESIQSDLQALQNNISLEFTADMLVEGFIESLRNDDLDTTEVEMRSDILSQFQAQEVHSLHSSSKKENVQMQRTSGGILGTQAKGGEAEIREKEPENIRPLNITGDFRVSRGVHQEKKRISFFPSVEVITNENQEGAWTMTPESKYVE